jgi:hypothetical protein
MRRFFVLALVAGCSPTFSGFVGTWRFTPTSSENYCGDQPVGALSGGDWQFIGLGGDEIALAGCPLVPFIVRGDVAMLQAPGICPEIKTISNVGLRGFTVDDGVEPATYFVGGDAGDCSFKERGTATRD